MRNLLHIYRKIIRYIRTFVLSQLCAEFGKDVLVFGRVRIDRPEKVYIGDNCSLNENILIIGCEIVRFGKRVVISPGSTILSASMDYEHSSPPYARKSAPVNIGDNVWIGACSTILPGITIGEGAVIGAGAVVTKDIPPNMLVTGVPATIKKELKPYADRSQTDIKRAA